MNMKNLTDEEKQLLKEASLSGNELRAWSERHQETRNEWRERERQRKIKMLEELEMNERISQLQNKKRKKIKKGYVYLLAAIHDATLFKIGRSKKPDDRLSIFTIKLPFPVEFECFISTENMYKLEAELHQRFAAQRLDGEFFRLSPTDVSYIKGLATP